MAARQPYARATSVLSSPVPEDRAWAKELKSYEHKRTSLGFSLPKKTPPRVSYARVKAEEAAFNPVTGRYVDPSREITRRQGEQESRARQVVEVAQRAKTRDRTSYNILTHADKPYASSFPSSPSSPSSPSYPSSPSPSPQRSAAPRRVQAAGKSSFSTRRHTSQPRTTANHSHYTFDIVSGAPLPSNSERIAPPVRSGRAKGLSQPEGYPGRWARSSPGPQASSSLAPRSYDIVTGTPRKRPSPSPSSQSQSQSQSRLQSQPQRRDDTFNMPRKGKSQFHISQSIAPYNILNNTPLPSTPTSTSSTTPSSSSSPRRTPRHPWSLE